MLGFKYLSELVNASFNLGKPWFLMHMHLYIFLNGVQFFKSVTWLAVTLSLIINGTLRDLDRTDYRAR